MAEQTQNTQNSVSPTTKYMQTILVDESTLSKLEQAAARLALSKSDIVRLLINQYADKLLAEVK